MIYDGKSGRGGEGAGEYVTRWGRSEGECGVEGRSETGAGRDGVCW